MIPPLFDFWGFVGILVFCLGLFDDGLKATCVWVYCLDGVCYMSYKSVYIIVPTGSVLLGEDAGVILGRFRQGVRWRELGAFVVILCELSPILCPLYSVSLVR